MPHGHPRIRLSDGQMNLIGERLKECRKKLGLTQVQLSGQVAVVSEGAWTPTRYDIRRVESGSRTVTDVELVALAACCKCSVGYLICGSDIEIPIHSLAEQTFRNAQAVDDHTEE